MAERRRQPSAPAGDPTTTNLQDLASELSDLYPMIEAWIGVRSSVGAGSGGSTVPVNMLAMTLVNERYWVGETAPHEHDRPGEACLSPGCASDPENWRCGIKLTVAGLERSARAALGFGQLRRARPSGYAGNGTDIRVLDALAWLRTSAAALVERQPTLADTAVFELARVIARCSAMIEGPRYARTWSECEHCALTTVVSDEDRAVCVNPLCRRFDGLRHCWQLDGAGDWQEVEEPDRKRRGGRLTDLQLHDKADD